MTSEARLLHWTVWGFLVLVVVGVMGAFGISTLRSRGPTLPVYGTVPDFHLTNQFGKVVSQEILHGRVSVAAIIFTRCAGPCLEMTRTMKAIQERLPKDNSIQLVSLTADPDFDQPTVLKEYADRFKTDSTNWQFLTGPKADVYTLAMSGLKLAVQENPGDTSIADQFIHSTRLVLIDGQGRLRGMAFDGTEPQSIDQVVAAVHALLREK